MYDAEPCFPRERRQARPPWPERRLGLAAALAAPQPGAV